MQQNISLGYLETHGNCDFVDYLNYHVASLNYHVAYLNYHVAYLNGTLI